MEKQTVNNVIDILNDLIRINSERALKYEKTVDEMDENSNGDLIEAFSQMAHKSQVFKNELLGMVLRMGGKPDDDISDNGKIYQFWKDLRSSFSKKPVLEACEFEEDATLKAYDEVLDRDFDYPEDVHNIIINQRNILEDAYGTVKQYRDTF